MHEAGTMQENAGEAGCHRLLVRVVLATVVLVSTLVLVLFAGIVVTTAQGPRPAATHETTPNNLKQLGLVCKMYANEHDGLFPALAKDTGVWMMDLSIVAPGYLTDSSVLLDVDRADAERLRDRLEEASDSGNKRDVEAIGAQNFMYFKYVIQDKRDIDALIDNRESLRNIEDGLKVGLQPIVDWSSVKENPFELEPQDSPGLIPVFCEKRGDKTGARVLFKDGHVELVPYGRFPLTDRICDAFDIGPGR